MVGTPGIQMHHRGGEVMRRYRIVDIERFERFKMMLVLILVVVFLALFIRFMSAHDGIGPETVEYHTYEIVQVTSPDNHRVKTPAIREVVYKTIYR